MCVVEMCVAKHPDFNFENHMILQWAFLCIVTPSMRNNELLYLSVTFYNLIW